jgi:hypothetical protein
MCDEPSGLAKKEAVAGSRRSFPCLYAGMCGWMRRPVCGPAPCVHSSAGKTSIGLRQETWTPAPISANGAVESVPSEFPKIARKKTAELCD